MFTGTPAELRVLEQRAAAIAKHIADLVQQLDDVMPGSIGVHNGQIVGLGVTVRRVGGRWAAEVSR